MNPVLQSILFLSVFIFVTIPVSSNPYPQNNGGPPTRSTTRAPRPSSRSTTRHPGTRTSTRPTRSTTHLPDIELEYQLERVVGNLAQGLNTLVGDDPDVTRMAAVIIDAANEMIEVMEGAGQNILQPNY